MTLPRLIAAVLLIASTAAIALEPGAATPAFELPALDGATTRLADFKGKIILVDFWASWCGPCRQSLPAYDKLNAEFAGSDFAILAVNLDEDDADAAAFRKEHPVHYAVLRDPAGEVPKAFGVTGMPTAYLVDRAGIVRWRHSGFAPADIDTLRTQIHALLEKSADAK